MIARENGRPCHFRIVLLGRSLLRALLCSTLNPNRLQLSCGPQSYLRLPAGLLRKVCLAYLPLLPPIYRNPFVDRRAGTLEDDYALGVILFQFLSGEFPTVSVRSRSRVYRQTHCPDHLRLEIEKLLKF